MKKGFIAILTLGVIAANVIPAIAYPDRPYTNYNVPANYGNNYTSAHQKTTNNLYSFNQVTAKSVAGIDAWITNSSNARISDILTFRTLNKWGKFDYFSSYGKGDSVKLGLENSDYSTTNGRVSGIVDFQ